MHLFSFFYFTKHPNEFPAAGPGSPDRLRKRRCTNDANDLRVMCRPNERIGACKGYGT